MRFPSGGSSLPACLAVCVTDSIDHEPRFDEVTSPDVHTWLPRAGHLVRAHLSAHTGREVAREEDVGVDRPAAGGDRRLLLGGERGVEAPGAAGDPGVLLERDGL